jgi:asparagine synthetase B (glutamine-hydrolysing)
MEPAVTLRSTAIRPIRFRGAEPPSPRAASSLCGSVRYGWKPALVRLAQCQTWPTVIRHDRCEIAIDGYFVLDGRLRLGRLHEEQERVARAIAEDLPAFLARIDNGFFNIVVHDHARGETRFASDPFGALPLYIARRSRGLFFASTYPTLQELLGRRLEPDPVGIAELYWWGYQLGDRTSYLGVEHIPAGTILTVRWADGAETRSGYASDSAEQARPDLPATSAEMAEDLVAAMIAAQKRLHRADARYGVKLSAGMDSRLVCGTWPDAKLRAYTHGFPGSAEMRLASALARALVIPHTEVPVTGDFFTTLHAPVFESWGIAEYFHRASLPAMRRDAVELVLDGLGGDLILGGLSLKRRTSPLRQALGLAPKEALPPETDEGIADAILSRIRVPDADYRPLTAEAAARLAGSWQGIRADMIEEVRKARARTDSFHALYTEVLFRNRTRRLISLQGSSCRPQVETLYPFLDRDLFRLLGRIPEPWVANKRLYLEIYTRLLPQIRAVPGVFSLLPYTVPPSAHYAGRVVRYALERAGLQISFATGGRLHLWAADGIQWRRWLAFNKEFRQGVLSFLRASAAFDEKVFDAAFGDPAARVAARGARVSGTRFLQTATYCGYFR